MNLPGRWIQDDNKKSILFLYDRNLKGRNTSHNSISNNIQKPNYRGVKITKDVQYLSTETYKPSLGKIKDLESSGIY